MDCKAQLTITTNNGRIVIGSWYNNNNYENNKLKLDTRFHRSGIQLKACQVSHIPHALLGFWEVDGMFLKRMCGTDAVGTVRIVKLQNEMELSRAFEDLANNEKILSVVLLA